MCGPECMISISCVPTLKHNFSSGKAHPPECKFSRCDTAMLEHDVSIDGIHALGCKQVEAGCQLQCAESGQAWVLIAKAKFFIYQHSRVKIQQLLQACFRVLSKLSGDACSRVLLKTWVHLLQNMGRVLTGCMLLSSSLVVVTHLLRALCARSSDSCSIMQAKQSYGMCPGGKAQYLQHTCFGIMFSSGRR